MNIALSLRKYGESRLGILMRLWLANKGHFKVGFSSIRQLLGELSSRDERLKDIDFDNQLEDVDLLISVLNKAEGRRGASNSRLFGELYWNGYIKNCPKCAKVGYHCGYFNAPWMTKCHIHGEILTKKCPECSDWWPSFSGLKLRTCSTCGVRNSTKLLQERGAFDCETSKFSTELIEGYFEDEIIESNYSITECDLYWRGETSLPVHNHTSYTYPSFVAKYKRIGKSPKERLKEIGIPIFEMKVFEFGLTLKDKRLLEFETAKKLMAQVRKEVLIRAESQLLSPKRLDHKFRSCFGEYFDIDKGCPSCATYDIIVDALSQHDFDRRDELFRYYVYGTYRHIIREPGLVHYTGEGELMCVLTERFMALLYEVELWTQIRVLYYKLSKAASADTPSPNMTQLEWANRNPRIASTLKSYTFPFFFARGSRYLQLFIPKEFLKKEIEVNQDFIDMYFPKEPTWIHQV